MNHRIQLAAFIMAAASAATPAFAGSAIVNSNFEAAASGDDGDTPGFQYDHGYARINDVGAPYGHALELNVYSNDPSNPQARVEQALTISLSAGTYHFTADVASPFYFKEFNGGVEVSFVDAKSATVVATGTFAPTDSQWTTLDFDFVLSPTSGFIGDSVDLVITHTGVGDSDIDNLSLTQNAVTSAVPEPSTWALTIGGLGSIGWMRRRRRNAEGVD